MTKETMIDGRKAQVLDYFSMTAMKSEYVIYGYQELNSHGHVIYIGEVKTVDGNKVIEPIDKSQLFLIKNLVKELINGKYNLVKVYKYMTNVKEGYEVGIFVLNDSQKMVITDSDYQAMLSNIDYMQKNNLKLMKQGEDEYYLNLLKEEKQKRMDLGVLIFLVLVLIVVLVITVKKIMTMV